MSTRVWLEIISIVACILSILYSCYQYKKSKDRKELTLEIIGIGAGLVLPIATIARKISPWYCLFSIVIAAMVHYKDEPEEDGDKKDKLMRTLSLFNAYDPNRVQLEIKDNEIISARVMITPQASEAEANAIATFLTRQSTKFDYVGNIDYDTLMMTISSGPKLPTMLTMTPELTSNPNVFKLGEVVGGEQIEWKPDVYPHVLVAGSTGGGKSVCLRNMIFHCLNNPDTIDLLMIDMKRTEFGVYKNRERFPNVLTVATTPEDAAYVVSYAVEEMMSRAEKMEQLTAKDGKIHDKYLKSFPDAKRLVIVFDEIYEAFTDKQVGKEIKANIAKIGRLGRALAVHIVMATQRPDAKVLGGGLLNNVQGRVCAGPVNSIASSMILGSTRGAYIPKSPKGRTLSSFSPKMFQGYYLDENFIENMDLPKPTVEMTPFDMELMLDTVEEEPKQRTLKDLFGP